MPLLRLHLGTGIPGEYPEVCILCGQSASSLIERPLTVHRSLEGTWTQKIQVPACDSCMRRCSKENLFKWLTALGALGMFVLGIYLLCTDWPIPGLVALSSPIWSALLYSLYFGRCAIRCQELTGQYALIDLGSNAFADAYRAHMGLGGENEEPRDMIDRMLAEGFKRAQILQDLEKRGLASMQAVELLNGFLGERRSANRQVGLRRVGYGAVVFSVGVGASVVAPNTIFIGAIVIGFAYFTAGVVQLLTGTGNRLN
jgi:hypothetical protein